MIKTLLLFLSLFFVVSIANSQVTKGQKELGLIRASITKNHYLSPNFDDAFSEKVFNQFITNLDTKHLQFTSQDIKNLAVFKYQLDDEWNGKSWGFIDKFIELYTRRIEENQKQYKDILSKPIDFEKNDFINEDSLEHTYASTQEELSKRWINNYKIEALDWLLEKTTNDKIDKNTARLKLKSLQEIDLKKANDFTEKKKNNYKNTILSSYFNAFLEVLDPHTNYYPAEVSEKMLSYLSITEQPSLGIELEESKNEEIIVNRLIPGGAAWKDGNITKGDILLAIKWNDIADSVFHDLSNLTLNEIYSIIETAPEKGIKLTVKKSNGQLKTVQLEKELAEDDEELVKGFMLVGKKKIGYISLSSFYSDFEENSYKKSCANDLTKVVVLLNKEKIDGLIVDIRNNGGGAVSEAMNIAGVFIDEGPFMVSKVTKPIPKLTTEKDLNRGTVYDGPLVVLTNRMSASAAELLASILQTYHRAIIVGDTTFGKGSFQRIEVLDTNTKADSSASLIKITMGLCYGLTGKSWQQKGVYPDIVLPELTRSLLETESKLIAPLKADEIQKKPIFEALPLLPLVEMVEKSKKRVINSEYWQKTTILEGKVNKLAARKNEKISLKLDNWLKKIPNKIDFYKTIDELDNFSTQLFAVKSFQYTSNPTNDEVVLERWEKNIKKDAYIDEAYQIVLDYLEMNK